ncbi:hypothetical protein F5888DRAFT_1295747 [Russula emetica]|nr:hypothetical protein F5888DRAFT_1295747 [Russula emetica]
MTPTSSNRTGPSILNSLVLKNTDVISAFATPPSHTYTYHHADDPEYDEHVFNVKTRALRDRISLAGKIFQAYTSLTRFVSAISHLSMFAAAQPSDLAFGAVLTKYLEGLRNLIVRPETNYQSQGTSFKGRGPGLGTSPPKPWWWKYVVVRKSFNCSKSVLYRKSV